MNVHPVGGKRSLHMADLDEPLRESVCLPEDVLFLLFDILKNIDTFPFVCKDWKRSYELFQINEIQQKNPIQRFHLFTMCGKSLTQLNLKAYYKLDNKTLMSFFANCQNLQEVVLESKFLKNVAFKEAQFLTSLRSLSLNCRELTHTIFKVLPNCTSFQKLTITTHKMKSLIHLPKLGSLTTLNMNLSVSYCNDHDFQSITKLGALKILEMMFNRQIPNKNRKDQLANLEINLNYITRLKGLAKLEKLILHCRDYELSEEGITNSLLSFTTLKILQLQSSVKTRHYHECDGFDLSIFEKLTHLDTLCLKNFKFNEDQLANIGKLFFLRGLELNNFCFLGKESRLFQSIRSLTALKLLELKGLTFMHKCIKNISDLEELSNLEIDVEISEPSQKVY